MAGHLELDSTRLEEVARNRGWSESQVYNARRIIDGGLGTSYGYKEYEETTFDGAAGDGLEGFGWVYYLYNERVGEIESLI